jgi:phage-related tail fiber protein
MAVHFTPIANGEGATPATFNSRLEELDDAIEDLRIGALTMSAPDIDDFSNAQHNHTNAANGGTLSLGAVVPGLSGVSGQVMAIAGAPNRLEVWLGVAPVVASIMLVALGSPPLLHLQCNGAAVSRATYATLFSVIGTTFGAGDGVNTFNLPNISAPVANTMYVIRYALNLGTVS